MPASLYLGRGQIQQEGRTGLGNKEITDEGDDSGTGAKQHTRAEHGEEKPAASQEGEGEGLEEQSCVFILLWQDPISEQYTEIKG